MIIPPLCDGGHKEIQEALTQGSKRAVYVLNDSNQRKIECDYLHIFCPTDTLVEDWEVVGVVLDVNLTSIIP